MDIMRRSLILRAGDQLPSSVAREYVHKIRSPVALVICNTGVIHRRVSLYDGFYQNYQSGDTGGHPL